MAHIDSIINFANKIDELVTQPVEFHLQVSYDGEWATNNIRLADADTIKKNAKYLIKYFSNIQYKNLKVTTAAHNVLSYELMEHIGFNEQNVLDYENEISGFYDDVYKIVKSSPYGVSFNNGPGLQVPYKAGTEDGKFVNEFYKNYIQVLKNNNYNIYHSVLCPGLRIFAAPLEIYPELLENPNKVLAEVIAQGPLADTISHQRFFCGANVGELKIMWDGTVVPCQASLYETRPECLDYIEDDTEKAIKKSLIDHGFYINFLKDSEEDIARIQRIYEAGKHNTLQSAIQQSMSLIYLMAKAGQVDSEYLTNYDKLVLHSFLLATNFNCQYNTLSLSGIYFIKDDGFVRLWCNGLIDTAMNYYLNSPGITNNRHKDDNIKKNC